MKNKSYIDAAFLSFVILIVILSLVYDNFSKSQDIEKNKALFMNKCAEYQTNNCAWSLTKTTGFQEYLSLCKSIYGQDKSEYSCLYTYCPLCRTAPEQLDCTNQCSLCQANKATGLSTESCCANFNAQCANTARCSVC